MKIVIALALCLALATASVNFQEKDSQVHYDYDSNRDGLFGFLMKGVVDPINDQENRVSTFLRLASELIPLVDVLADGDDSAEQKLEYSQQYCYGQTGGAIQVCLNLNGKFWVGWWAFQKGITGTYDATITPFALAQFGGNATLASYPAQVGYGVYINALNIQVPIGVTIGQTQLCYEGTFQFNAVELLTTIFTSLLECQEVIPEGQWGCQYVPGAAFQHLSYNFTNPQYNYFLPRACINF